MVMKNWIFWVTVSLGQQLKGINFWCIILNIQALAVRCGLVLLQGSKWHTSAKNVLKVSP